MFAIFRYKCNLNGKDNIGFGTILSNNIKYYKDILAILISIPLVTNANTIFGSLGAGIIILILIATYFGLTIDFYKPSELDKLSKSIPEKRAEIIPDNNSINNIINNVADKAKQAVEVGKKALAQGKEKATESFNKFTSGIASKIPAAPIVQIPTTPMVTPMVTPMTQGNIIKGNDNLTK
jgi:hypothetical protein